MNPSSHIISPQHPKKFYYQFSVQPHVVEGQLSISSNVDGFRRLYNVSLDTLIWTAAVEEVGQVDGELNDAKRTEMQIINAQMFRKF